MITWSPQFESGDELVDTQHQVLIDKLNELEMLLEGPLPSKQACDQLLGFLGDHVAGHFSYEEDCMHRARCPAHARNKHAHKAFLDIFAHFKARYEQEGPSRELLRALQVAASQWTETHILTLDVQLRPCLAR